MGAFQSRYACDKSRMTSIGLAKITEFTIGVDISKSHLDVFRLEDEAAGRFENSAAGFRALVKWLGKAAVIGAAIVAGNKSGNAARHGLPFANLNLVAFYRSRIFGHEYR